MNKRSAFAVPVVLLVCLTAAVPAFGGPLVVRNEEDQTFHFAIDPPGLAGGEANTLSFRLRLIDWFLQEGEAWPFTGLSPKGTVTVADLPPGRHLLVGFFEMGGSLDYPVGLWEVQAGTGAETVTLPVRREASVISVRQGEGRLARLAQPPAGDAEDPAPAIRLDQQYEDWEGVPSLATFSGFYEPASFTRQTDQGWEVLPMSDSRHWKTDGTQLNEIKVLAGEDDIWFFVSAQSSVSTRLSIFLYFHDREAGPGQNRVTLEIAPGDADLPGVVLLWPRGSGSAPQPEAVGRLVSGGFFMEGRVSRKMVEAALGSEGGPEAFFDLTSCYFDRSAGSYEEFYFTTIYLRDIPRVATR